MEMTLDEVIKEMELEFNTFLSETGMGTSDAIKHEQATNVDFDKVYTANKTAIDIMRKYQEIEQIIDDCDLEAWEVLENVKEVVADGNE